MKLSTLEFVPEVRAGGVGRTERRYFDATVDGVSLSKVLDSDRITPFVLKSDSSSPFAGWLSVADQLAAVDRLLGLLPPDLPEGRTTLYICSECADLGCGVESMFVEFGQGGLVRWYDFGLQNSYEDVIHRDGYENLGPYCFQEGSYRDVLERLRRELQAGGG